MAEGRFSDAELESMMFDPSEPAGLARCPWCGQDVVLGVRRDTRNVALAHAAQKDPLDVSGTRFVSGCPPFNHALTQSDVLRVLTQAGARFQRLVTS